MTSNEYKKLYAQARRAYPRILRESMTELGAVYEQAGKLAAEQVRAATASGASRLTVESWDAIRVQLNQGAAMIRDDLQPRISDTALKGVGRTSRIHTDYIMEAAERAGAGDSIKRAVVSNMYVGVDERVVRSVVNRIYQDGYTLSNRVWQVGESYANQIEGVISAGLAQGRDLVDIAEDLQVYIADGKTALANRFGPLERGSRTFMRRIGDNVDWRALRLVRSELYASIQEASREQGHINPAATDEYDWLLESGRQHWGCTCPGLSESGPYEYDQVPGYPHPNCRCEVRPVMQDGREFNADLKRWVEGESVPYLNSWYQEHYLATVA